MKKLRTLPLLLGLSLFVASCGNAATSSVNSTASQTQAQVAATSASALTHNIGKDNAPVVYFTKDLSGQGLIKVYEALGRKAEGKVGIKVSFEAPNAAHLDPQMLKPLADKVKGTLIDSNNYVSPRNTTSGSMKVAADHGYTAIAPVEVLDADGELDMPVVGGKHLKIHRTGSRFVNYDSVISIVHFKPHSLRDYGGTIKNLTICLASPSGKGNIHSGGDPGGFSEPSIEVFLESMADGVKVLWITRKITGLSLMY